jgi:hypothetical protein
LALDRAERAQTGPDVPHSCGTRNEDRKKDKKRNREKIRK